MKKKNHYYGDDLKTIYCQIGKDISSFFKKESNIVSVNIHDVDIDENPKFNVDNIKYKQPVRYLGILEYEIEKCLIGN